MQDNNKSCISNKDNNSVINCNQSNPIESNIQNKDNNSVVHNQSNQIETNHSNEDNISILNASISNQIENNSSNDQIIEDNGAVLMCKRHTTIKVEEAITILNNVGQYNCTDVPPWLPHGGNVYIFKSNSSKENNDWRCDHYQWGRHAGTQKLPSSKPVLIQYLGDHNEFIAKPHCR